MKIFEFNFRGLRRFSQLFFLLIFLILFRLTDYHGKDEIPVAVNILFRIDPLVAISAMLSQWKIINLLLPAFFIVALTLIFGRIFCGWLCPMGTILDGFNRLFVKNNASIKLRKIKYFILFFVIFSSVAGLQLVGLFDPFSILVRGLTIAVDPAVNYMFSGFFNSIYLHFPKPVTNISEPFYDFLKDYMLPYKQSIFLWVLPSAIIFIGVIALEFIGRRFWCRNLCPLGALLALFSKFTLFRRFPPKSCRDCENCATFCRMNAFDKDKNGFLHPEECNLCMDCIYDCVNQPSKFRFNKGFSEVRPEFSRRGFIAAFFSGCFLAFFNKVSAAGKSTKPEILRPPGALKTDEFYNLCVRCGECMKVCIGNALHPNLLESGIEGMFSPRLIPRLGYCEFNCTLCGQVCPTGAIKKLNLTEKHKFVIGTAYFIKDRCLPYAKHTQCIVCEEHCPTFDKAIKFKEREAVNQKGEKITLKEPYIITELCIGCGICENKCPLPGDGAVMVIRSENFGKENDDYVLS
jgi:polyferredoxin